MTNKEAIRVLKSTSINFSRMGGKTAYVEALEMAITALQELDKNPTKLNNSNNNSNNSIKDCISRQAAIDTEGLDAQIRCEMCRNPMHTDRGCDGNCKYDEKLYERIMQILDERIKPLPSVQPDSKELSSTHKALDTISRQAAIDAEDSK